jgi:hypothetical protein
VNTAFAVLPSVGDVGIDPAYSESFHISIDDHVIASPTSLLSFRQAFIAESAIHPLRRALFP